MSNEIVNEFTPEELEAQIELYESELERLKSLRIAPEPTPQNNHDHKWESGVLPGNKRVRICTVPGCGLTEAI